MASPVNPASADSSMDSLPAGRATNLDDVVEMFLASKKSLACIQQVGRAQEIVDHGKEAVEENAVLAAKNSFTQYAISVQMDSLLAIRLGIKVVDNDGHEEMRETVNILDKASSRLNDTLDALREVSVDQAFRPEGEEARNLFDFVDESGVNTLYIAVKESMDRFDAARNSLLETCRAFDKDLKTIHQALEPEDDDDDDDLPFANEDGSPIPAFYTTLEDHATDLASNLQGLVKHYDMCVTALKHTEGGGDAILKFSQGEVDHDESKIVGIGLGIARLDDEGNPKPVSAEEYANMVQVLVRDASEVDEVVNDVQGRLLDMETIMDQVEAYVSVLRSTSSRLDQALLHLKRIGENIPSYINACAEFQGAWEEEKELLAGKLEEMEHGQEFYQGFASGYYNMILEVQRRRKKKRDMDRIARMAMTEIEKLHKADAKAREDFRAKEGEHLPSDIWPGLSNPPARYEINVLEDEYSELPQLKQEVVEEALRSLGIPPN